MIEVDQTGTGTRRRYVSYPKAEYYDENGEPKIHHEAQRRGDAWFRSDAWEHLSHQKIPGCPKQYLEPTDRHPEGLWVHGWRKAHTDTHWRWYYEGEGS